MRKKGTGSLKPGSRNAAPVSPDLADGIKKGDLRISFFLHPDYRKLEN